MTLDMESVFRRKVEEKEEKMVRTSKEEEEKLELSKKELDEVKEALERKRAELEEEKKTWESENNTSLAGILLAGKAFFFYLLQPPGGCKGMCLLDYNQLINQSLQIPMSLPARRSSSSQAQI